MTDNLMIPLADAMLLLRHPGTFNIVAEYPNLEEADPLPSRTVCKFIKRLKDSVMISVRFDDGDGAGLGDAWLYEGCLSPIGESYSWSDVVVTADTNKSYVKFWGLGPL